MSEGIVREHGGVDDDVGVEGSRLSSASASLGDALRKRLPLHSARRELGKIADWLTARFGLPAGMIDQQRHILPLPGSREGLFFAVVAAAGGSHPVLDAHLSRTRDLARSADEGSARRLVGAVALALQASLMVQHAPLPVAEAFVAARLGGEGGHLYGVLPPGADVAAVLERV